MSCAIGLRFAAKATSPSPRCALEVEPAPDCE